MKLNLIIEQLALKESITSEFLTEYLISLRDGFGVDLNELKTHLENGGVDFELEQYESIEISTELVAVANINVIQGVIIDAPAVVFTKLLIFAIEQLQQADSP